MKRFLSKINPHYFFVIILSLNYVLPILIFNNITLFYHDALDHEIVYNKILGKVLSNGIQELEIFLNGQIEIEFLRRVFHPITYLYYFFNFEIAYWITDISLKIISYLAFYTLAKKISVDKFNCCLVAALYASINLPTHLGIGFAIIPYLIYLINFKKFYSLKNYFIIISKNP